MNRGFKYRIYPDEQQYKQIMQTVGCARFVYNDALDKKETAYKADKTSLSCYALINMLPVMKQQFPWLKDADSSALQQSIRHLDDAYTNFFKRRGRYPKHKSRRSSRWSYKTMNIKNNIRIEGEYIRLPKVGNVTAVISRKIPDGWRITSAVVSVEHDGTCFVSLQCEKAADLPACDIDINNAVGLDYKSDGLYMDSNGNAAGSPKYYRRSQQKLTHEQRKLRHKHKGSKNYRKQCREIAKAHRHIKDQRLDFLHKLSTAIAKRYDLVCVEDLDMKAISNKGFGNGKATMDNGYGMFLRFLEYKLLDRGKVLVKVNRWFPSSQLCSSCGSRHPITLSERTYICPECGVVIDRDHNAAINILTEGIRVYLAAA